MGLDMYLTAKRYFKDTEYDTHTKVIESVLPEIKQIPLDSYKSNINSVTVEVGSWRKANQIHHWFLVNLDIEHDDGRSVDVSGEELKSLKEACEKVLKERWLAKELLPTCQGFFFGSSVYDDYYFENLKETVKIIDIALALPKEWEFEYRASW
jgi:hypothetical protein